MKWLMAYAIFSGLIVIFLPKRHMKPVGYALFLSMVLFSLTNLMGNNTIVTYATWLK